jgi:hypothetical protein
MRPVLWGLIASLIGLAGWIFFSIIYTFAKMAGSEATLIAYFFLSLFFMVMLFGLPVGAAFDLAKKKPKFKYVAYGIILIAIILWAGILSVGISQEVTNKPIIIRDVNIVIQGKYKDYVMAWSLPPVGAQYGEFKIDVKVSYLKPLFGGPEYVTVKSFRVLTSGFDIVNVEPKLPFNVGSSSITFTLTLKGPKEGFDGPITIEIALE